MLALGLGLARAGEDCEAAVRRAPDAAESWRCFYLQARREGDWEGARARLLRETVARPENGHAWLNLAHIAAARGGGQGVELYGEARDRYAAQADEAGLVQANIGLAIHQSHLGAELEEVLAGLDAAEAAAERTADPLLRATVQAQRARVLWRSGVDLGRAYALVREAEQQAFPDGPYQLRLVVLHVLAGICQETGRLDESHVASMRMVALTAAEGDRYVEATARLNVAHFAQSNPDRVPPGTGARESRLALEAAEAAGNPFILAGALCTRAGVLQLEGAPSLAVWERCATAYTALGEPLMAALGELGAASALAESDPAAALQRAEGVVAVARQGADESLEVLGRLAVAGLSWQALGPEAGRAAFAEHHAAAERLLDHQTDAESRAGVLSNLTDGHHLLAWLSLEQGPDGVDAALAELERLRARELTDTLRRTELLTAVQPEVEAGLAELGDQLSRLNIALGAAESADERATLAHRRRALEYEEAVLRDQLQRSRHPSGRAAPRLADIQAALGPGEVLLSFQTPPPLVQLPSLQTGPWVLAISHDAVGAAPLPARRALEAGVPTFAGLFADGDALDRGATGRAAAATWEQLVAPGLRALGRDALEAPERLILLLDGPLHELPFAVLRPRPGSAPLGTTTAISRIPSLTSWLALRDQPGATGRGLVLGDPPWPRAAGPALPGLPAARREAEAVGAALGAELRLGEQAREAAVKRLGVPRSVLHLAAHGRDPQSSAGTHALVLGEGEGEDGLLEAREVRDLPLAGTVVVLSACRGASGRVLEGDGLDGLSRAFLLAGAPVVVGSLWPVSDGEAAAFFARLAEALAEGHTVDAALREVRGALRAEGRPAGSWAGMVAIGDADRRVAVAGRQPRHGWAWAALLVGLAGLALGWVERRQAQRSPRR